MIKINKKFKPEQSQIIIFDIDRTLAKITDSYEMCIKLATKEYLELFGYQINLKKLASEEDFYQLWQKKELSDVWYLTYALSAYYLAQMIVKNQIEYKFSSFVPLLLKSPGCDKYEIIQNAIKKIFKANKKNINKNLYIFNNLWQPNILKCFFQNYFIKQNYWSKDKTTIPVKELIKLLSELNKKFVLGIATARPKEELMHFLKQYNLSQYFQSKAIISLEAGGKDERILQSLKKLTQTPEKTASIYIGDTVSDIEAVNTLKKKGVNIRIISTGVELNNQILKKINYQILIKAKTDLYVDSLKELNKIFNI